MSDEYLSPANIRWIEDNFHLKAAERLKEIASFGNTGLAAFKMSEDLSKASGMLFKHDTSGHGSQLRKNVLARLLAGHQLPQITNHLQGAFKDIKRQLNLLRHPERYYGIEIKEDGKQELKVYLQTNLRDEIIEDGNFSFSSTTCKDELNLTKTLCGRLSIKEEISDKTAKLIEIAYRYSLSLDMLGVDVSSDGLIEIKPYLGPQRGNPGIYAHTDIARHVLTDICSELDAVDHLQKFINFMNEFSKKSFKVPINAFAAEPGLNGQHKIRIYFELWKMENSLCLDDHIISVPMIFIKEILEIARQTTGFEINERRIDDFIEGCRIGEMVLDTFSLEYSKGNFKIKFYVRPEQMRDHGLKWRI